MTAKRITAQEKNICSQNYRAESDAETVFKPKCLPRVVREKNNKNQCQIKKITMNILQNQRKCALAAIIMTRFADGAAYRVSPKRLVIRAAIVITGKTKSGRRP